DPALRAQLALVTEQDENAYVVSRLQNGVTANSGLDMVDVLFHVNTLTAGQLDGWIDQIIASYVAQGRGPVVLDVPDAYLQTSDQFVDPGVRGDIFHLSGQ